MRVLLTGGAGFIGSHLAEGLLERGEELVILDDFNDFYDPGIKFANLEEVRKKGNFALHRRYRAGNIVCAGATLWLSDLQPGKFTHRVVEGSGRPDREGPEEESAGPNDAASAR